MQRSASWAVRVLLRAICILGFARNHCTAEAPVILGPNGNFGVNFAAAQLTDPLSLDPWSSEPTDRSLMISVFYPSSKRRRCRPAFVPYVPPDSLRFWDEHFASYLIPRGTIERVRLQVCEDDARITAHLPELPLVLFLPGHPLSRFNYNAMALQLASEGMIVVTMDVPYDAPLVDFPDGRRITGIPWPGPGRRPPRNWTDKAIAVRVEDVSFVLDELSKPATVRRLLPTCGERPLRTNRAVVVGHSFGGATAAVAMAADARVVGAANLDGIFFGPEPLPLVDRPFLLFGSPSHAALNDTSWPRAWPRFRGWKLELLLEGAEHFTFTDDPFLLASADNRPANASSLHGTIDGRRAFHIINTYITAFVKYVTQEELSPLLQGPARGFSEIVFNVTNGTTT